MYHSLQNAHKLFVKIPHRHLDVKNFVCRSSLSTLSTNHYYIQDPNGYSGESDVLVSWSSTISNLVRQKKPKKAIVMFKTMLANDQRPNYITILSTIRAAREMGCIILTRSIHGLVIKMGFESEVSVVTAFVGVYSVYDMEIAHKLFDHMPQKDVVLWSAMISACANNGSYSETFELVRQMQNHGLEPNHVTIVSILPVCADLSAFDFGKQIHALIIKRCFDSHTNVQNSLIDMYAKCSDFGSLVQVFHQIKTKDLVSWKSMIHGCNLNDNPHKALHLFCNMRYNFFKTDENVIQEAIAASIQAEQRNFGLAVHSLIVKSGFCAFDFITTTLLQMYAKFGEIGSSRNLFDNLDKKDFIAYSAMISAYAQSDDPSNAFDIFKQMKLLNEKPNEIIFVSLLQASSAVAAQEIGESIHAYITKAGYLSNTYLNSALIDLYYKFGKVRQGREIFDENLTKDLVCWSSMINGYGLNGCGNEALETFSNMLDFGIYPNDVIFISVLSACSHCGFESEGWNWFYSMEGRFGISSKLAHYACMVDLLSRQGKVKEAFDFVTKMPLDPDQRIWGAILAGCRKVRGSFEIAEISARKLIDLDPENTSYYVFLSNLYADEGRWEDAEKLRTLVQNKGLKKEIGYSVIYD